MVFSPPVIEMRVDLGWSRRNARTRQGAEIPGHDTPFDKNIGVLVMALLVRGSDHHFPGSYLFSWSGRPKDKNWFAIGANLRPGRRRPAWTTPYALRMKGHPQDFSGSEMSSQEPVLFFRIGWKSVVLKFSTNHIRLCFLTSHSRGSMPGLGDEAWGRNAATLALPHVIAPGGAPVVRPC